MPRKSTSNYPDDWPIIAKAVKEASGWRCVRCDHPHDPKAGYCLTVHHLDMNPANNAFWNTPALCQKCHLQIQHKVILERPWLFEHSEWFRPFVGGFFAWKYLGLDLTRGEVMANLDYYVSLEIKILQGESYGG